MVPSAPGKRFDGDTKVTDLLYKCYNIAVQGEDFGAVLQEIKERYYVIVSITAGFSTILGSVTRKPETSVQFS